MSGTRHDRWLGKTVSTGTTRATSRRTYLGHPNHPPSTVPVLFCMEATVMRNAGLVASLKITRSGTLVANF